MAKYCSTCTKTGKRGERVEMDELGSHRKKGEKITVYQCPICDTVKAKIRHKNGLETTRTMSADEVAKLETGGGGLLLLGLAAVGLIFLAGR